MRKMIKTYKCCVRNLKERHHYQVLRVYGWAILRRILKSGYSDVNWFQLVQKRVHSLAVVKTSKETWGSIKGAEFLERLSDYEFLKKDSLSFELTSITQSLFGVE